MNDEERKTYVYDCEARRKNKEEALNQKTKEVLSELIKRVGEENVGQTKPGSRCGAIRLE